MTTDADKHTVTFTGGRGYTNTDYVDASDGTRFNKGCPVENVSDETLEELRNQSGMTLRVDEEHDDTESDDESGDNPLGDSGDNPPGDSGEEG